MKCMSMRCGFQWDLQMQVWMFEVACRYVQSVSNVRIQPQIFFIWKRLSNVYGAPLPQTELKVQMCLFTIKTQLTRGNNAECVKALRGEQRTKPIFVSQLALPPDWAAPLCATSHRKALPLCIQQATLMCKCMQENFRKAKNYWAKWGSGTQIVGIMNNYCVLWNFPQFPVKQWLQWLNWKKNSKSSEKLLFSVT